MAKNRIREHRERVGISQQRLAEMVGTTPQQISRLERGDRRVSDEWLPRLATALHVRQGDLLIEVEGPAPSGGDLARDEIERRLISFWRDLSDEAQDVVLGLIETWARNINHPPIAGHRQ